MTNKFIRYFKGESKVPSKGSYFASLAVSIILLYVVNNLRYMGIAQLTEKSLISCLWAANIIFSLLIVGNFTLVIYRPVWFHQLVQMLITASGVNAFLFIYKLYPFNLENATLNSTIKVILILIMTGFFAAFLLALYRFGINVSFPKKKPAPSMIPVDAWPAINPDEIPEIKASPADPVNPSEMYSDPSESPFSTEQKTGRDQIQNDPGKASETEQLTSSLTHDDTTQPV